MIDRIRERFGPELAFAAGIVVDCCRLAERVRGRHAPRALEKEDRSPVTVADFAIQALVGARLESALPGSRLVAEESADYLRSPEHHLVLECVVDHVREFQPDASEDRVLGWVDQGKGDAGGDFWVLDPVDGTKGFLRNAHYAVALARVVGGAVQLGILGCPRLRLARERSAASAEPADEGSLLFAVRGRGAWALSLDSREEPRSLRVSSVSDPADAVLLRSVEKGHTNLDQAGRLSLELGVASPPIPMDSQAKYGLLAGGEGDFLVRLISPRRPDYREKIWDQAAGVLLVEEAGGRVTDLDGRDLDFTAGRQLERNRGVLATNGLLHDRVLQGLRALGA